MTSTNDPVTARTWFEVMSTPSMVDYGPVEVELGYQPSDPYAVRMTFLKDDITWVFARDLLRVGLKEPAGWADVRVWPAGNSIWVRLEAHQEWIVLKIASRPVRDFVTRIYETVPVGQEPGWLNLDMLVTRLLSDI